MDEVINYLKDIQENLVGIIVPVLITAIVTLITLIINTATKLWMENRKYNNEQFEKMKKFYPTLRTELIKVDFQYTKLKTNNLHTDIISSVIKYAEYKNNGAKYRKNHENEISNIDDFINTMERYLLSVKNVFLCLNNVTYPSTPIFHPVLKHKVRRILYIYGYFSLVVSKYLDNDIYNDLLISELKSLRKKTGMKFNEKVLEDAGKVIDKWFFSF